LKYIMLIGDGMADMPMSELGGKTPLESLALPAIGELAGGELGRLLTCPPGFAPGSDIAFLTLLGHDPASCYTGRSPLEAAGVGVDLADDEVSLRVNMITINGEYPGGAMDSYNAGGIEGREAAALMEALCADHAFADDMRRAGMNIHITETFRHIAAMKATENAVFGLTPAHDIAGRPLAGYLPGGWAASALDALQARAHSVLSAHPVNAQRLERGLHPANGIWFWGEGRRARLENFDKRFNKRGAIISAVPLARGIGRLSGLDAPAVAGATGALNTNCENKVKAALSALRSGADFALVHLEAPDDESHAGSFEGKLEAIRMFDERIVKPMINGLRAIGEPFRAIAMPDHYTLLSTRSHGAAPVPFALYDSRNPGKARPFSESLCENAPLYTDGGALLRALFIH
jgi:2,3-bisphosphoglycerate-independent phosphoglycerate mutase